MLLVVLLVMTLFAIAPPTVSVRPLEGIVITVASTMEDGPESMIKMTMVESEIMVRVVQCKRPGKENKYCKKIPSNCNQKSNSVEYTWPKERILGSK